jgi:uncharacterized repeat protein (TIGR03803 family)
MSIMTKLNAMAKNHPFFNVSAQLFRRCRLWLPLMAGCAIAGLASPSAQGVVVFSNLVSFNGTNGYSPSAPLLQAKDGNFYGTTVFGGAHNSGTVFQFTSNNMLATLASFNGTNGYEPSSGLIQGANGSFYGTTSFGGPYTSLDTTYHLGFGTVFQITNGALNTVAAFSGTNGAQPSGLVQASNGTIYGGLQDGPDPSNPVAGAGGLFTLDTNYNLATPFFFSTNNGANPVTTLVLGTNGSLYGTTSQGGSASVGTVFKFTTNNTFSSLDSFGGANGFTPNTLTLGSDGNFYGTTFGSLTNFGTIFQLRPDGALTTLASFQTNTGYSPSFLIQASDGNFYGTTHQGGAYGFGTIFELTTNNGLIPLYSFAGTNAGPVASSLIQAADGNFYGTTSQGGNFGQGSIFKLSLVPNPDIRSLAVTNGVISITWPAASGQHYRVQFLTNLTQTNWSTLTNITASGATGTATDSTSPDAQRFYRVVLDL